MEVQVKFIAPLKPFELEDENVMLPEGSTVKDLLSVLEKNYGKAVKESIFTAKGDIFGYIWINRAAGDINTILTDGDDVLFVPPIGGG